MEKSENNLAIKSPALFLWQQKKGKKNVCNLKSNYFHLTFS